MKVSRLVARVFLLLIIGLAPSCSLTPLDLIKPTPDVEVNAQVAKSAEIQKSVVAIDQGAVKQTADEISNDTHFKAQTVNQITNQLTPFQLVMLCLFAGWALPDPVRCYAGIKYVTVDIFKGVVVYPIASTAKFILRLFDRGN